MLVHPPGPPCLRLQGKMYHSDCLSISLEAFGPLPAGKWVAVMGRSALLPAFWAENSRAVIGALASQVR